MMKRLLAVVVAIRYAYRIRLLVQRWAVMKTDRGRSTYVREWSKFPLGTACWSCRIFCPPKIR